MARIEPCHPPLRSSLQVLLRQRVVGRLGRPSGKTKEAIEVLELDVEAYPRSADVYDSLGEACMADGQTALAVEMLKKLKGQ